VLGSGAVRANSSSTRWRVPRRWGLLLPEASHERPRDMSGFETIPVIDLQRWTSANDENERTEFAGELVDVCHRVGFLLLVGHGVPEQFVNRLFQDLARFFALPEETKSLIDKRNSREFRGWERVGAELTNNQVDFREQVDISTCNPRYPVDCDPSYLRLDGPNQWFDDSILPGHRAVAEEFMATMKSLADTLMSVISRGLGLADDHLKNVFGERPLSLAKLIHYPATPEGECGVNAHHDAGFLTILLQHDVGGLQAMNPEGKWIDVPPTPGAFVINLGEMLQEMSGNYIVATTHRVIATQERLSAAYFHGPDLRTPLDPLPLDSRFVDAVLASPRHSSAGFMAKRDELLNGADGTSSVGAGIYGQQLWNYYARSYPENMALHHGDIVGEALLATSD
jgi:isopenicillin N synthase-like dioxygenase